MTYADLVRQAAKKAGMRHVAARRLLDALWARIAAEALLGERVTVPGFGTFRPKTHKPRRILNPQTGAPMYLSGQTTVGFRASSAQRVRRGTR